LNRGADEHAQRAVGEPAPGLRLARSSGEYGVSFAGEAHLRERWASDRWSLLALERAALRGFDDPVVLRRCG